MREPKRISIFTGHFGSGKTEIAINYAFKLKEMGKDVIIIDMDIVNPYFRTKDAEIQLKEKNIQVIYPHYANTNLESPSLPPEINIAFEDKSKYVIFDVGGDDDGATPLGRYYHQFSDNECETFFVINERRILTQNINDTLEIMKSIESVSGLKINLLINNTHLKELTTADILLQGQLFVEKYSEYTGIEIAYITGKDEFLKQLPEKYKCLNFPLNLYINLKF
ncbi:MAG: hypothetical protein RSB38_06015 [Oscillospiraceae bacterium]